VHSVRTVLGLAGIAILRFLAMLLRVLGHAFRHLGTLSERLYDLPLFVPLWLEARAAAAAAQQAKELNTVQEANT
jgi:hypothetical protein